MLHSVSARADARLLACALILAPAAALAETAPQPTAPFTTAANTSSLSDAVLRSAVASADFSALSLARANTPAPSASQAAPSQTVATQPARNAAPVNGRDLDCMTQAVYFESKGEPLAGQAAVAQVVLNRVRHPLFPKSVCGVVFQRAGHSCQFSWACRPHRSSGGSAQWAEARAIATRVMRGEVIAAVGFATHFNGVRARGFGSGLQRVAAIGGHAFYRFNGSKGSASMFGGPVRVAQAESAPQTAPRAVYASLLPLSLPSGSDANKAFASASAAVQNASSAVRKVMVEATQSAALTLAMQTHLISPPKPELVAPAVPALVADVEPSQVAPAEAAKPAAPAAG